MKYKYHLQKYAGIASRHTCPACGAKRCFALYVDDNGDAIHESVGRCDHESSCGYHYTPKQFFQDHPEIGGHEFRTRVYVRKPVPQKKNPLCTIPLDYVTKSVSFTRYSDLTSWLLSFIDPLIVEGLTNEYQLGLTSSGDVIYFQIDRQGRCRSGKIMKYDPVTGHRIKDENKPDRIGWVHSILKSRGILPNDWELTQCLFGEHLLERYPDKKVILVESEKTALIGDAFMPKYVWLATGGKSNLNPQKLEVLRGREVIAYPDLDALEAWKQKLSPYPNIRVSDLMKKYAEQCGLSGNADLADWIIANCSQVGSTGSSDSNESAESPESEDGWKAILDNPQVQQLIEELDLELVGVGRTRPLEA